MNLRTTGKKKKKLEQSLEGSFFMSKCKITMRNHLGKHRKFKQCCSNPCFKNPRNSLLVAQRPMLKNLLRTEFMLIKMETLD